MSASFVWKNAHLQHEKDQRRRQKAPKFGEDASLVSSGEFLIFNFRGGGSYGDLP
jgi:hypothetical protein